MTTTILLLILGLVLIVVGADILVDGASTIARKAGVSEFVIGLTIVGFGTSCPELVVSLNGAFKGIADISVGNVIGSNIMNILLILGLSALIRPIPTTMENKRLDIPLTLLVTFLMVFLGMNRSILGLGVSDILSRVEGIVFLVLFGAYIFFCIKNDKGSQEEEESNRNISLWGGIGLSVAGLAALISGGQWFVDSAVEIASRIGVSDKFIAITVLAGGTSLPELATCVAAAIKKKGQLALGNILGSCVFNVLFILGCSAVITPLSFEGINLVDMAFLVLSAVLVWLSSYTFQKDRIDRIEGAVMISCFALYYVWLFSTI